MTESRHLNVPSEEERKASETLISVILRRSRYVVAVLISGLLLSRLAGYTLAPPAEMAGSSLLLWSGGNLGAAVLGIVVLLAVLLATTIISMLLIHPDAPHTALFCSFLGLAYLATSAAVGGDGSDGGTIRLMLAQAQQSNHVGALYNTLATECLVWAVFILVAEWCCTWIHHHKFRNTHWLTRHGITLEQIAETPALAVHLPDQAAATSSRMEFWMENLGSLALAGGIVVLILALLLRSEEKGQTLFAGFVAGLVGGMAAVMAFPRAKIVSVCLAVPLAVALGYWWIVFNGAAVMYPGYSSLALGRAMPIDVIAMGVPGAILGAHSFVRTRINQVLESE